MKRQNLWQTNLAFGLITHTLGKHETSHKRIGWGVSFFWHFQDFRDLKKMIFKKNRSIEERAKFRDVIWAGERRAGLYERVFALLRVMYSDNQVLALSALGSRITSRPL